MTTRRNLLSKGSLSVGSASRAEMCEQPILSIGSSEMASGVAAELERDRVAVLGDAAMERHSESHGPVMPRCRKVLTHDGAERVE